MTMRKPAGSPFFGAVVLLLLLPLEALAQAGAIGSGCRAADADWAKQRSGRHRPLCIAVFVGGRALSVLRERQVAK
jgi:hypothetical protein